MLSQFITFKGATKAFSKQPFEKLKTMHKIKDSMPDDSLGVVGKVPQDIVELLVLKNEKPQIAIRTMLSGLSECSNILQKEYENSGKFAQNFLIKPYLAEIYSLRACGNKKAQKEFVIKTFLKNDELTKKSLEIEKLASEKLTQVAKQINLIPEKGKVVVSLEGQGSFGIAYRLEFFDENNQDIVHPKIMKVFPSGIEAQKGYFETRVAQNALFHLFDDDIRYVNQEVFEELKNEFRDYFQRPMDYMTRIRRGIKPGVEEEDIHGFLPEVNRGLFISTNLGKNAIEYNVAPFYFANLNDCYYITEMIDRRLPMPDKKVVFANLNLYNTDGNRENIIHNRLVDYGGMQTLF